MAWPRRLKFRIIFGVTVFSVVFVGIVAFWFVEIRLRPTLVSWAKARAEQIATVAIQSAVSESLAKTIRTEDLVFWKQDIQGALVAAQYDMAEINRVVAQATLRVYDVLKTIGDERIPMPLGQVFGSSLLAAWGPTLYIKLIPVGTVKTNPYASFKSGGINQVWHRIYLDIKAQVRIVVPTLVEDTVIETQVPIAEEILMGRVPEVYLNWASTSDSAEELMIPLGVGSLRDR
ncbi:MAG: sporulation protein YunB [Limnochordia bacterium]|jgi:sporulation protein YunB